MRLTFKETMEPAREAAQRVLDETARAYLTDLMDSCQTQSEAGRIAGCDRKYFYWLLMRHDVPRKPVGRNDCARKVSSAVCQVQSLDHAAR